MVILVSMNAIDARAIDATLINDSLQYHAVDIDQIKNNLIYLKGNSDKPIAVQSVFRISFVKSLIAKRIVIHPHQYIILMMDK